MYRTIYEIMCLDNKFEGNNNSIILNTLGLIIFIDTIIGCREIPTNSQMIKCDSGEALNAWEIQLFGESPLEVSL